MAADFPQDLRYTASDEWVRQDGDTVTVGITAFAAEQLGDIVYVQLPESGKSFAQGDSVGEIESVKAVSDLYAPLGGEVVESNSALDSNPGTVNEDPYGHGWLMKLKLSEPDQLRGLLDADSYARSTTER